MNFASKILTSVFILIISLYSLAQNPFNEQYKDAPDGETIYYWPNGQIATQCVVLNGNIEGKRRCYYKSGELLNIENYKNGLFHGKVISFNKNGGTTHIEVYKHDTLIVLTEYWYYKNSSLKTTQITRFIEDSTLNRSQLNVKYFGNYGKMSHRKTIRSSTNVSETIWYYKNGIIKSINHHYNEYLDGLQQSFYNTGQLKLEETYIKGIKNGTFLKYDKEGGLTKSETYINGELTQ